MNASEILENHVAPYLDAADSGLLDDLHPKRGSKYWTLDCPKCQSTHKKSAYYWETGAIVCNRIERCQYTGSIWSYLIEYKKMSKQEAFLAMCSAVNVDPSQFEEKNTKPPVDQAFKQIVRDFAASNPKEIQIFCADRKFTQDDFNTLGYGYYPSANEVREAFFQKGYSFEEISSKGYVPYKQDDERKNNAYFMAGRIIGFWKQADGYSYWGYLAKSKRNPNSDGKRLQDKKYLIASSIKKDIPYSFRGLRPRWPVFVEGTIDADTLNLIGINSGATGFNRITEDQAIYLASKNIKQCTFMMDGDFAGLSGAISTIFNCASQGIECWIITTPFALEDADAMRQNKQYSELFSLMDSASKPGDFLANAWVHSKNTEDSRYLGLISLIEDGIPDSPSFISREFNNQLNLYGYTNMDKYFEINKLRHLEKINFNDPEVIKALNIVLNRGK